MPEMRQDWTDLAGSLQVSHHELLDFHQRHFSPGAVASFGSDLVNLMGNEENNRSDATDSWDMEGDDNLGYYEDGVKRTLTDEQIEIFRHSELRDLQRQQERAKASSQPGHNDSDDNARRGNPASSDLHQSTNATVNRNNNKKKKKKKNPRQEPKPDLRKRTWDVVDAGLDSLNYD